ncbi:MAG TPA: FAD/NAD(P)-binding protein [Anaerolineae bacterium]|nr:FAD/NAD(P)-binding protein [Anaerolineae bacterium]
MTHETSLQARLEESIYLPQPARIVSVQQMTALEKLFTLELQGDLSLGHEPGQFVEVSALGVGEAPISISSSPSRSNGTFELCVRRAGDVTGALHRMQAGQVVGVRGPFGHGFPAERFQGKDILFASGGLGLAPARSLINQVLDERGKYGRVIILYGAKHPSELLFMDEVAQWRGRDDVEVHLSVDRPAQGWSGNVGVITTLFPQVQVYARNTVAVVVGPPAMYRFVLMELLGKGILEGNIWLSLERRMKCGVGKCGHCQMNHIYTCQSGPVFSYAEIKGIQEAL